MRAFARATVSSFLSTSLLLLLLRLCAARLTGGLVLVDRDGPVRAPARGQRVHALAARGGAGPEGAPEAEGAGGDAGAAPNADGVLPARDVRARPAVRHAGAEDRLLGVVGREVRLRVLVATAAKWRY